MPVYQQLVDHNVMFHRLSEPPIIINDLVNNSMVDKELIQEMITTKYSSDMISLLPSCRCGTTKGEFSIGVVCEHCYTTVKSSFSDEIEPSVWFRVPIGVKKLINPIIWIMLKNRFKKSGFNIMQWLCDRDYRPQVKTPQVINRMVESGIQRGYNNFIDNFDLIMEFLFSLKDFSLGKDQTDYLRILISQNRHLIFSDYIPLPNKSLLIIEKTNVGVYVDPIIIEAVDAIETLVSIDTTFYDQSPRVKENRTIRALSRLAEFYEKFYKTNLSPKLGQFRRHVYGSRTNSSFRAVISSLTDTHSYDEIHVPWGIGVTAFRPHLLNKLFKLGWDHNSAVGLLLGHVEKHHDLLEKLLNELIEEAPGHRLICNLQRNPSLEQGSSQRVGITKFKTDPADHTISMSILICKAFNATMFMMFLIVKIKKCVSFTNRVKES